MVHIPGLVSGLRVEPQSQAPGPAIQSVLLPTELLPRNQRLSTAAGHSSSPLKRPEMSAPGAFQGALLLALKTYGAETLCCWFLVSSPLATDTLHNTIKNKFLEK